MGIVQRSAALAKKGLYDDERWVASSFEVFDLLEKIGLKINISGFEHIDKNGPCVFIGNHMSMMETLLLPAMIVPIKRTTFVIKESLLEYPVFKYVMRSRDPIAVTRTNPRQDLKTVMTKGLETLNKGCSVVVFPQTTRTHDFDPAQMSTIGVKLAQKAGVPVIPIALQTDAWTNGKIVKDFGRFDLSKTAYFAFGEPFTIDGKGKEEQQRVNAFIMEKLASWKR